MDVRICRKEEPMEYMRTQASIEKFVIITMRDGRKKYVGRRYSFKDGLRIHSKDKRGK